MDFSYLLKLEGSPANQRYFGVGGEKSAEGAKSIRRNDKNSSPEITGKNGKKKGSRYA